MICIAGLGNPGEKFPRTRHNAGYMFVDEIYKFMQADISVSVSKWELKGKFDAWVSEIRSKDGKNYLLKSNKFMNQSGLSIGKFLRWQKGKGTAKLILAYDDLDLELGKYKITKVSTPQSHNGVNSVVTHSGVDFVSVRLGVDNREGDRKIPGEEYVLQEMTEDELVTLGKSIDSAIIQIRSEYPHLFKS